MAEYADVLVANKRIHDARNIVYELRRKTDQAQNDLVSAVEDLRDLVFEKAAESAVQS